MDNTIISKLEKELNRWSVSTEVIDLNDEKIDNDTFEPNCVEVVLSLKKDKEIFSIPFQVSNTLDIGEFSPSLSIDSESGATEELRRFLQTIGINEDEVPDWELEELGDWLKEKFQQITSFLMSRDVQHQLGITMADGGELPVGILANFDARTWEEFNNNILS